MTLTEFCICPTRLNVSEFRNVAQQFYFYPPVIIFSQYFGYVSLVARVTLRLLEAGSGLCYCGLSQNNVSDFSFTMARCTSQSVYYCLSAFSSPILPESRARDLNTINNGWHFVKMGSSFNIMLTELITIWNLARNTTLHTAISPEENTGIRWQRIFLY